MMRCCAVGMLLIVVLSGCGEDHLAKARELFRSGEDDALAIHHLDQVIARQPGHADALAMRSLCQLSLKRLESAEKDAVAALASDQNHWRAHEARAFAALARKQFDIAERHYREAVRLAEDTAETRDVARNQYGVAQTIYLNALEERLNGTISEANRLIRRAMAECEPAVKMNHADAVTMQAEMRAALARWESL